MLSTMATSQLHCSHANTQSPSQQAGLCNLNGLLVDIRNRQQIIDRHLYKLANRTNPV